MQNQILIMTRKFKINTQIRSKQINYFYFKYRKFIYIVIINKYLMAS